MPDPFLFTDGRRVKSADDWAARRAEILELIQQHEYGHLPPPPKSMKTVLIGTHKPRWYPNTQHQQFKATCELEGERGSISFVIDMLIPLTDGPKPVIVRGDWGWRKTPDDITKEILARGYILAEFNRVEIVPDLGSEKTDKTIGLWSMYPDADFGAIAAWAWGYHRVVDFLLTRPEVDKDKIAITGHSRGGKTVLLAGATDPRIALTAPNNSGCGGAGCFRFEGAESETLEMITRNFPFWFSPKLREWAGKEDQLPLDQHFVKALVAPRAFLSTEALGDLHANPSGSLITHQAAAEVYKFLGTPDRIAIQFRPGSHEHNVEDFRVLLDFADEVLMKKKPATQRNWNPNPFGELPKAYSWTEPGS